jgi:transposase InsO family protein
VVVDRLTKLAHFIPTKTDITAKQTAELIFNNIVSHHGYPESIVSDRDPKFTSLFWQDLAKLTGTQLKMSTARHAQTDGQTERINQTLEVMLRSAINHKQDNWEYLLPSCEFTHNSNINRSTGFSPFMLNYGYEPKMPATLVKLNNSHSLATDFIKNQQNLIKEAKVNIEKANQVMKKYYNKDKKEVEYRVNQQVMISRDLTTPPYLKSRQNRALQDRWHGPYKILQLIGKNAVKVELPNNMRIHPVISTAFIKLYNESTQFENRIKEPSPPVVIDNHLEYEVDNILNSRKRHGKMQYLVLWKNYPINEATWENESNLANARDIINKYESNQNYSQGSSGGECDDHNK